MRYLAVAALMVGFVTLAGCSSNPVPDPTITSSAGVVGEWVAHGTATVTPTLCFDADGTFIVVDLPRAALSVTIDPKYPVPQVDWTNLLTARNGTWSRELVEPDGDVPGTVVTVAVNVMPSGRQSTYGIDFAIVTDSRGETVLQLSYGDGDFPSSLDFEHVSRRCSL